MLTSVQAGKFSKKSEMKTKTYNILFQVSYCDAMKILQLGYAKTTSEVKCCIFIFLISQLLQLAGI